MLSFKSTTHHTLVLLLGFGLLQTACLSKSNPQGAGASQEGTNGQHLNYSQSAEASQNSLNKNADTPLLGASSHQEIFSPQVDRFKRDGSDAITAGMERVFDNCEVNLLDLGDNPVFQKLRVFQNMNTVVAQVLKTYLSPTASKPTNTILVLNSYMFIHTYFDNHYVPKSLQVLLADKDDLLLSELGKSDNSLTLVFDNSERARKSYLDFIEVSRALTEDEMNDKDFSEFQSTDLTPLTIFDTQVLLSELIPISAPGAILPYSFADAPSDSVLESERSEMGQFITDATFVFSPNLDLKVDELLGGNESLTLSSIKETDSSAVQVWKPKGKVRCPEVGAPTEETTLGL